MMPFGHDKSTCQSYHYKAIRLNLDRCLKYVGVLRSDKQVHNIIAHVYWQPCGRTEMEASEVASSRTGAVHGVIVGQLSPVKLSRKRPDGKYFEGLCTQDTYHSTTCFIVYASCIQET